MLRHHPALQWAHVQARLDSHPQKLNSFHEMENTGVKPDVVAHDSQSGEFIFFDCSPQSPTGRRSLCYDCRYNSVFVYHNGADSYFAARGFRGALRV